MATKGQNTKGTATLSGTLPQSSAPSQPLFPRLHVNEGGKGGPRAPPRNKMALYEHLTVPSHRFVPGTATLPNTPTPAQGSGYEGRYLFSSSFLSPTVAFSAVNMGCQVHSQSSAGVSYDSAMVDGNKEIQRVPGVIPNGSIGMLSSSVGVSSGCYLYANSNQTNPSGKKVRDEDDFRVPQYSNSRISSSSMIELHSFKKCQPTDSNPGRASVVASNMSQHEAALPCSTWVDVQGECLHLSETEMQKTQDGTDGHRAECENVHAISKVQFQIKDHREQSKHLSDSGNVSHDYIGLEQPQSSSHITDVVTLGEHMIRGDCVIGKVDDINSMKSASTDSNAASEGLPLPAGNFGREESQQPFGFDDERRADEDGPRQRDDLYPVSSLKNTRESTDEFENSSDGSAAELSVPSQPMQGSGSEDGSDSSMVDSEPFSKISPDDVIGAIGKQQFWKARKAILRQQRIFSVQVFELHRLIKVQQLMAMSPILLIENSAYVNAPFGKTAGEKILSDYVSETKTERKINDGAHIIDQPSSNTGEPAVGQLAQPGVACHPGWFNHGAVQTMSSDQNVQMYVGACPVMPLMIPGGMSAWGFPHPALGTGQWLVPTASPSGDFMHKPFPGIFPPPAAFTSPTFGTPGSLGFPPVVAASQGSEHLLEFEPRYGLPMSNLQYGAGVCSVPVVAPNFVPAWYGLPFPMVDSMQRANVHGTPLGTAHNGATQDGVAPNPLESLSRPTQLGQPSVETPIPCSGIFSHQQQTNNTSSQSILQDGMRSSSHANQTSRELNAHPQGLYNVSIQERGICGEQIKEKRWELSEGSHSKEINNLVGVDSELQERGSTDGSERTSKRVRERDMEMNIGEYKCKMTLEKDTLTLFPLIPSLGGRDKPFHPAGEQQSRVIRVVPCDAVSAPESTAGILLSIQQERQSEVNKKNVSM